MPDMTMTRKQRLRTLENEIRSGMEEFYYTGMKLKEIRDDELYKEDGFATWLVYLKERWEWSQDYAYKLMKAAEYRAVLPSPKNLDNSSKSEDSRPHEWSESTVRELTRIEDKRDAAKVAAKVVKAVEQSEKEAAKDPEVKPLKLTAATVRKFVDEDLGVDRAAKAKETKQQREEAETPDLRQYLVDMTGRIEAETAKLATVNDEAWKQFNKRNPKTIKRLIGICAALTDLLRRIEG